MNEKAKAQAGNLTTGKCAAYRCEWSLVQKTCRSKPRCERDVTVRAAKGKFPSRLRMRLQRLKNCWWKFTNRCSTRRWRSDARIHTLPQLTKSSKTRWKRDSRSRAGAAKAIAKKRLRKKRARPCVASRLIPQTFWGMAERRPAESVSIAGSPPKNAQFLHEPIEYKCRAPERIARHLVVATSLSTRAWLGSD